MTLYRTPGAAERLRALVPRFLERVPVPVEARTVATRFGDTTVHVAGPRDAPPVVLLHGAVATGAHSLAELGPLLDRYRVYAPNVLGHSPMSADARPPLDGYGDWSVDVLDALGLTEPLPLIGVSYGGFVAVRTVIRAPERFSRLTLIVPGGIVHGSTWDGIVRLALPLAWYRWSPTEARLRAFLEPQFTTWDPLWAEWMAESLQGFKLDFRVPPLARPEDLAPFTRPTQVFAASQDLHFPGGPLLARAKELFPGLADTWLIDAKHSPAFEDGFRREMSDRIARFLAP